jgi:hypothetical protein
MPSTVGPQLRIPYQSMNVNEPRTVSTATAMRARSDMTKLLHATTGGHEFVVGRSDLSVGRCDPPVSGRLGRVAAPLQIRLLFRRFIVRRFGYATSRGKTHRAHAEDRGRQTRKAENLGNMAPVPDNVYREPNPSVSKIIIGGMTRDLLERAEAEILAVVRQQRGT